MSSEERGSPGAGTSTCTRQLAWAHCWARTPANFPFFFLSSWKKKSEVKLTGESKATTAFCGLQSWVQTVIVRLCNTVHFCCLLAAAGGRNCSESCRVTGSQEKGCRGRRLHCLPELSLLIFSWAGNTVPYCYFFFLMPGSKARSSAGINRLYFSVAEEGRRMHSSSGSNLPFLETWVLLFPDKNQITTFICSIIKYVNIFQKHNFPMTQSAFK